MLCVQMGCLEFLECVYTTFGFTFQLRLATRPEKYLGDLATWDEAEKVCTFFIFNNRGARWSSGQCDRGS
jgi:threonyl-tRNA synthetase